MPHSTSMPQTGFQALILCGPGVSLNTFTSVPAEYPKALIPIANRPMIWYVLDWCYRMGVSDITLITPPQSQLAISAALQQNPYLTSLPLPSPDLLAPSELTFTTGTAELLRLKNVQDVIRSDFLLLPCDLVCDVAGEIFLEAWMTHQGGLGGANDGVNFDVSGTKSMGLGGEKGGRRGGMSVWYNTTGREESVKGEECDFNATVRLDRLATDPTIPLLTSGTHELYGTLRKLVYATPMDSLREESEEAEDQWQTRVSLCRRYGNVKNLTKFRDSHIYFFPYWVKDFAHLNESFESISEDLVGTWAKTDWRKPSYRAHFKAQELFPSPKGIELDGEEVAPADRPIEESIDLLSLSSTCSTITAPVSQSDTTKSRQLASRVPTTESPSSSLSAIDDHDSSTPPRIPPIHAYVHSAHPKAPLIRRVDTTPLLLSVSLLLAKLPSSSTPTNAPLYHPAKISPSATVAPRTTITPADCLVGDNAIINGKTTIKESVIGPSASVGEGCRITKCVIMDGATIGDRCTLVGTIVGKKAMVGEKCVLTDCEVQDANHVAEGTEEKGEKFLVGGLEE